MKTKANITLLIAATLVSTSSCRTPLSTVRASALIRESYTGENYPRLAGNTFVVLDSLTIDSIWQEGNKARVFYRVQGTTNNGSAYEYQLNRGPQEVKFIRKLLGHWR